MARGEFVENSIWEELEPLSQDAALLYLWSFTNPRCNMAGLYKVSERSMLESKVSLRRLPKALQELEALEMAYYRRPWLWVKARVKRLHSKHANFARAVAKDIGQVDPDHPLRAMFLARYAEEHWLEPALSDLALESQKEEGLARPPETPMEVSDACASAVEEQPTTEGEETRALERMPAELREYAQPVLAVLRRVAQSKRGSKAPTLVAVAKAVTDRPGKDFLPAAGNFEHYWLHGNGAARQLRDVVSAFRNWLDREPDVASKSSSRLTASTGQNVMPLKARCRDCGTAVEPGYGAYCEECSERRAS